MPWERLSVFSDAVLWRNYRDFWPRIRYVVTLTGEDAPRTEWPGYESVADAVRSGHVRKAAVR